MNSLSKPERVEIYLRCLDCEVCGSEINPGREEYIRRLRVCPRCYEGLTGGAGDRQTKQRRAVGLIRRGRP